MRFPFSVFSSLLYAGFLADETSDDVEEQKGNIVVEGGGER